MSDFIKKRKEEGMKKQYTKCEINFIVVEAHNILTMSGDNDDPQNPIEMPVLPIR